MRIGILTQYFPPEMGAPQARLYELTVRLKNRGHSVTVLTAMPSYPTGRVFDGYRRRLSCTEDMDGLKIIRTPIWPSKSTKFLPRLVSYMSFVMTSMLMGSWRLGKQDILLVESPPLFLGLAGIPIAAATRAKLVFMVSDIWPDLLVRTGRLTSRSQTRMLEALEGFIYRRCACVALTNPGAVEQIRDRFPGIRCGMISNGVDTSFFRPGLRSEEIRAEFGIAPGQFVVGYCGLHGIFQGLEVVVDAAQKLRDHEHIRFVLVGDGPTKDMLQARAREADLPNLAFFPHQPKSRMPAILASMDVSVIPLAAALPGTMPSKVYEALAAGVPAVVTAGCEAEQLVKRYNVGRLFSAGDAAELSEAILELASDTSLCETISQNSVELARRFDRDTIAERTERLLDAVAVNGTLQKVEW